MVLLLLLQLSLMLLLSGATIFSSKGLRNKSFGAGDWSFAGFGLQNTAAPPTGTLHGAKPVNVKIRMSS